MAVPPRRVTAAELAPLLDTSADWIEGQTGVATRYYAEADTSGAALGAVALRQALDNAGLVGSELDLVLAAGATYDQPVPSNAALLLREFGFASPAPACWDVDATCLGFIAALQTADALIRTGAYRCIAIVTTEISSRSLNLQERESAALFGDAAAAVVLGPAGPDDASALLSARLETYPEGAHLAVVRGGGNTLPARSVLEQPEAFAFHMEGRDLLRLTQRTLKPFMERLFAELDFSWHELACFIPHQASHAGLLLAERLLDLPPGTFYRTLHEFGNCVAASLPLSLHIAIDRRHLHRGDRFCVAGTGAGFSLGGVVMVY